MKLLGPVERLRRQAARPVVSSLAATALIQLLGIVTGVLLARELGPSGRGALAAVVLWPTLLWTIGNLGVIEAVTFYSARDGDRRPSIAWTSLAVAAVQSLALIAIGLILVPLVLSRQEESVVRDCLIFLASIPTSLVTLYFGSVLNGAHRFVAFNVLRATVFVANTIGLVALAVASDLTVTNAMLAYLVAQGVTVLVATTLVLPYLERLREPRQDLARKLLSYGLRSQLSTLSNLLNERVDQLVISIFFASSSLGLYVVAWTMTALPGMIGFSVAFVALPAVARADVAERVQTAREYVGLTFAVTAAVAVPLAVLAPDVLRFAFGSDFVAATDLSRILLAASIALGTGSVLAATLKGVNRPLDAGIAGGVGLVVTAVGLAVLLPTVGITGAAITSLVAYTVTSMIALRRANSALGTTGFELLIPRPRSHRAE